MNSAVRVPRVLTGIYSVLVGFSFPAVGDMTDLGFDGCAVCDLLWLVFQLGFIFWSLGYSALSLGRPINGGRRSGMVHFGHQDELDLKLRLRRIYS
jgi:hypothetical protein